MAPAANTCSDVAIRLIESRNADELVCLFTDRFEFPFPAVSALQTQFSPNMQLLAKESACCVILLLSVHVRRLSSIFMKVLS